MSRPLRLEFAGATYHVTSRGDRREPIYRDAVDRRAQLAVLAQAMDRYQAQVLAYCQMGNHYHLVLHTREANLSRLMRHLNGVYTQAFNRRHRLAGHLFQGRFHAILVDRDAYLLALCRYVERNPVAAGLVAQAADWPWSSFRAHIGLEAAPPWLDTRGLHGHLLGRPVVTATDHRRACQLYARMLVETSDADLWQRGLRQQVFLGDPSFVDRMLAQPQVARAAAQSDGVPQRQTRRQAPLSDMVDGRADRARAWLQAHREGGHTLRDIARHVGLSVSRVSRLVARAEADEATCSPPGDGPWHGSRGSG